MGGRMGGGPLDSVMLLMLLGWGHGSLHIRSTSLHASVLHIRDRVAQRTAPPLAALWATPPRHTAAAAPALGALRQSSPDPEQ